MIKKIIFILIFIIFIGGVYFFINNPSECYDCGNGGWQKMNKTCAQKVLKKDDLKICFSDLQWAGPIEDVNEIIEGYIEIGGEMSETPTRKSIKVFIYKQWAVDENGNFYLLNQLG